MVRSILILIISAVFVSPLMRKSAVFVAPLASPDGRTAASLKLLTVRGAFVVNENPCARASPPKTWKTSTVPSPPFVTLLH